MQNYLCKRLHSNYEKLSFSYNKSTSYKVIFDRKDAIWHEDGECTFLQKSYNYQA